MCRMRADLFAVIKKSGLKKTFPKLQAQQEFPRPEIFHGYVNPMVPVRIDRWFARRIYVYFATYRTCIHSFRTKIKNKLEKMMKVQTDRACYEDNIRVNT